MADSHRLKSVDELCGAPGGGAFRFSIPPYQRGYRWTSTEVSALLDDLYEWAQSPTKNVTRGYILQPLMVVPTEEGSYQVVDGQQRLTTIHIILRYLDGEPYDITYETRGDNADFLRQYIGRDRKIDDSPYKDWEKFVSVAGKEFDTIDSYHLFNAWDAVRRWFDRHSHTETKADLTRAVRSAQFVWYEVTKADAQDAFSHVNSGKIPLTDAELIKALYFRDDDALIRIAHAVGPRSARTGRTSNGHSRTTPSGTR